MIIIRKTTLVVICILIAAASAAAQDFWNQPFETWTRRQVASVISDSPWAQTQTFSVALGGADAGLRGEKELFTKFTVRFFSARPVREAYVRLMQLVNNYDGMAPAQRQEFDTRFNRALNLDVSDRIILALEFASNNPTAMREMTQFFQNVRTDSIRQDVYLINQHGGRVQLKEYFPPSPDGTGAKFVFPRSLDGKPVIAAGDKEVRFEFYVPTEGGQKQKLLITFKVAKMNYHGELNY